MDLGRLLEGLLETRGYGVTVCIADVLTRKIQTELPEAYAVIGLTVEHPPIILCGTAEHDGTAICGKRKIGTHGIFANEHVQCVQHIKCIRSKNGAAACAVGDRLPHGVRDLWCFR